MRIRSVVPAVAVGVAVGAALGGCGLGGDTRDDWCRRATRSDAAFEVEGLFDEDALAAWERLEADAPGAVADDLRAIRELGLGFAADPETVFTDRVATDNFVAATERVDRFLREECGAPLPKPATADGPEQ